MTSRREVLAAIGAIVFAVPDSAGAQVAADSAQSRLRRGVERLTFLRGTWHATLHTPVGDGGWQEVGQTQLDVTPSMNDLYLVTEVRSGQYLYALVFSYDAAQDLYRITSRDDQSGLLDVYEGNFESSGALVVANVASGTHYQSGGVRIHNRMTFKPDAGSGWSWLVEATADGGATWRPQIRSIARGVTG